MAFTPIKDFAICAYASGSAALQNVEVDGSTNYSPPRYTFKPWSKQMPLGDGSVRGTGWATAEWTWDIITPTQRAWLRAFIPNNSAELFICTRTYDSPNTGIVFRCIGIWPIDSEELDYKRSMKFTIKFQRLTQ